MADNVEKKQNDIAVLEKSIQERMQELKSKKAESPLIKTTSSVHSKSEWWSVADAMTISAAVLIFGSIIIVLATYLLYKGKNADEVLKLFGTIIIIISAVFLVVAGYTDTQIAPVIGLLGTIAGYLLGRRNSDTTATENKPVEEKASVTPPPTTPM